MSKGYTIARLERRGETFEILVNPDNALRYKMGEKIPISKIIVYEEDVYAEMAVAMTETMIDMTQLMFMIMIPVMFMNMMMGMMAGVMGVMM